MKEERKDIKNEGQLRKEVKITGKENKGKKWEWEK